MPRYSKRLGSATPAERRELSLATIEHCPTCTGDFTRGEIIVRMGDAEVSLRDYRAPTTTKELIEAKSRGDKRMCPSGRPTPIAAGQPLPERHELPPGFGDRPSFVIGLVGPLGGSKSSYLYAIVRALTGSSNPLRNLGYQFWLESSSEDTFAEYYSELDRRHQLKLTQAKNPQVLTLIATRGGREVNLVIVDVSGEVLKRQSNILEDAKHIFLAHAYICTVPADALIGGRYHEPAPEDLSAEADIKQLDDTIRESFAMIHNVCRVVDDVRARRFEGWQPPMLCFTVAKADLIFAERDRVQLNDAARNALRSLEQSIDYSAVDHLGLESLVARLAHDSDNVSRLLVDFWDAGAYVDRVERTFKKAKSFHMVSATGSTASENGMHIVYQPHRVLDPVFMVLLYLYKAGAL